MSLRAQEHRVNIDREASALPRGGDSGDLDRRSLQTGTLGGDEIRIPLCHENRVLGPGGIDSRPRLLDRCLMAVARGAPLDDVLPSRNPRQLTSGMEFSLQAALLLCRPKPELRTSLK